MAYMPSVWRKPIPMAAHFICSIGEIICMFYVLVLYAMFHVKHLCTSTITSLLEKTWQVRRKSLGNREDAVL